MSLRYDLRDAVKKGEYELEELCSVDFVSEDLVEFNDYLWYAAGVYDKVEAHVGLLENAAKAKKKVADFDRWVEEKTRLLRKKFADVHSEKEKQQAMYEINSTKKLIKKEWAEKKKPLIDALKVVASDSFIEKKQKLKEEVKRVLVGLEDFVNRDWQTCRQSACQEVIDVSDRLKRAILRVKCHSYFFQKFFGDRFYDRFILLDLARAKSVVSNLKLREVAFSNAKSLQGLEREFYDSVEKKKTLFACTASAGADWLELIKPVEDEVCAWELENRQRIDSAVKRIDNALFKKAYEKDVKFAKKLLSKFNYYIAGVRAADFTCRNLLDFGACVKEKSDSVGMVVKAGLSRIYGWLRNEYISPVVFSLSVWGLTAGVYLHHIHTKNPFSGGKDFVEQVGKLSYSELVDKYGADMAQRVNAYVAKKTYERLDKEERLREREWQRILRQDAREYDLKRKQQRDHVNREVEHIRDLQAQEKRFYELLKRHHDNWANSHAKAYGHNK
ncbi:hypothetical protein COV18_03480 [Candidatus Woesearchaeota archaeon CG10_big_fil_rev_8_21_14_0_10_37_12]|nr:MAG: hypothetical protein COV18_03480 [Candidatus Woesearchaeota archaeon CG10_big_fil_rev_8_21_14_0_10_37_12]